MKLRYRLIQSAGALSIALALLITLFAQSATAQDLPVGLQKINEYNQKQAEDIALKVSFVVAFIAGILGIFSPCILPFLPAYFSYTFKEKKNIALMTLVFFLGFATVFTAMGIVAGFVGQQALIAIQGPWLVGIGGAFFIFMGILSFLGKGFSSFFRFARKGTNDITGIFLMGNFYALGW